MSGRSRFFTKQSKEGALEIVIVLIITLAIIGIFRNLERKKHRAKPDSSNAETTEGKAQTTTSRGLGASHQKGDSPEPTRTSLSSPVSIETQATEDQMRQDAPVNSLVDDGLYDLLDGICTFRAAEIFDSLPIEQKQSIIDKLREYSEAREKSRYSRLESVDLYKQKILAEYQSIEFSIAENDDWFLAAKEGLVTVTAESTKQHNNKARELYSRKKVIVDDLLPEADSQIESVISQIESEEIQESSFRKRDLEHLLLPFHEDLDRKRRLAVVAETKKKIRQREEDEARKQEEREAFLQRLRADELEKRRILAAEKQQKRAERIRAKVEERGIPYLVHFTPIANLESILEHGLRSRSYLAGHKFVFTDDLRADGWLDWISLSVSFPNYKMLYSKKKSLYDVNGWAVLLIKPDALWELECKFILTNAARSEIRRFRDDYWSSVGAFEKMFHHPEHRIGIPDYYPTDPQAEVMIKHEIPRKFIDRIAVESPFDLRKTRHFSDIEVNIMPELFRWRNDYEHWKNSASANFFLNAK